MCVADFRVLLDELGIETASAWCLGCQVRVTGRGLRGSRYEAVDAVPISADSTVSGAIKGAAWGVFIAGGLGAAVGSMVGGGMKVAFELHTAEGVVLRCIAGKNAWLDIRRQVEARRGRLAPPVPKVPRRISRRLLLGTALLPIPLGLGFWRRGYTAQARGLAAVWTVLWILAVNRLPAPPVDEARPVAPLAATADGPAASGAPDETPARSSGAAPTGRDMNDPTDQALWIAHTEEVVRSRMRDPAAVRFRRSRVVVFQGQAPMVCGEVNARNGFGGATGFRRFIAAGETFGPVLEEMMAPGEFEKTWTLICRPSPAA